MTINCCKSVFELIIELKLVEWMKNLPSKIHNESITKIAIPGKTILYLQIKISFNRYT